MMIPGLDYLPTTENELEDTINFPSFCGTFNIPRSQIYGSCRRISEFDKLVSMKTTPTWVYHKCRDTRKNEIVCIKKTKNDDTESPKQSYEDDDDDDSLSPRREIEKLYYVKHENILQFYEPAVGDVISNTYMIFERFEVFLSDLIEQKVEFLYYKRVTKSVFHQIILALAYIHKLKIMHRDVHPRNVMLNDKGLVKLANFENAREFISDRLKLTPSCENYSAPELLLEAEKHGPEIDIWAAGCLLSQLFLLEVLFDGSTKIKIIEKIFRLLGLPNDNIWPGYLSLKGIQGVRFKDGHSYNCLELYFRRNCPQTGHSIQILKDIFRYYPPYRITADEILKHPYFNESPPPDTPAEIAKYLKETDLMPKSNNVQIQ